jgi:predicted unusual protein kinase regulating ubiquinone biosynthesis (AarF/ABC1/UbiB family)
LHLQLKVEKLKKGDAVLYSEAKKGLAIVLRDKILQLGPTFIKLGQLLSTRIDVLPREYIDALVLLQDQVPGFPGDVAVQIIEQQLGKPIDQLYDTFDRNSIAAASLGQVHVATLNGKTLAVKVQRQGLKALFDMDLKNIKVLAILLDKFDPKSDGAQRDWVSIYDESAKLLYKEIDYEAEAQNAIRFKNNFANVPWVKVPDVSHTLLIIPFLTFDYECLLCSTVQLSDGCAVTYLSARLCPAQVMLNMTTSNVVTMEYVPGIKINDIQRIEEAGIDRQLLAKRSAEAYLTQLCRHGFFRKYSCAPCIAVFLSNITHIKNNTALLRSGLKAPLAHPTFTDEHPQTAIPIRAIWHVTKSSVVG